MRSIRRPVPGSCSHTGGVPLEQQFYTPDVVDQHIESTALGVDPLHERINLVRLEMIDRDCDSVAAGGRNELGGLFDRFGSGVL